MKQTFEQIPSGESTESAVVQKLKTYELSFIYEIKSFLQNEMKRTDSPTNLGELLVWTKEYYGRDSRRYHLASILEKIPEFTESDTTAFLEAVIQQSLDMRLDHYMVNWSDEVLKGWYVAMKEWRDTEGREMGFKEAIQAAWGRLGRRRAEDLFYIATHDNEELAKYPVDRFLERLKGVLRERGVEVEVSLGDGI